MSFAPGTTIGVYEVVALIGAGGMGEVYRARDPRLNRDVAIKILPDAFAKDPDRLARFQREAQILASLNHTNIAHIYGLERSPGAQTSIEALVMELVDGRTLAERIAQGPIPLDEALEIAQQLAEALEAAHRHGVIHRDLKPANIKIRPDGVVKVLDFGLAKALAADSSSNMAMSPTMTSPALATHAGVILGTAAYMSPEQARGKAVDIRTDIWAFGCVVYEMLTGHRAFDANDVTDTIVAIVSKEPKWELLPLDTPAGVRLCLQRALEKDPKRRLPDLSVALFLMSEPSLTVAAPAEKFTAAVPIRWRRAALIAAVVLAAALGSLIAFVTRPQPSANRNVTRLLLDVAAEQQLAQVPAGGRHVVSISPDSRAIVYAGNQLYLRPLDQLDATPLRGTDGAAEPFFSPDGRWIAFWQGGSLKKMAVTGGAPVTLCAAINLYGATWGADDEIFFGQGPRGIWRVPAAGGTPQIAVSLDVTQSAHQPQLLPDGRTVLYTLSSHGNNWTNPQIVIQSLDGRRRKVLLDKASDARYVAATGHLVYVQGHTLLAVPFNADSQTLTGGSVPLVEDVSRPQPAGTTGAAQFDFSRDGSLVYLSGQNFRDLRTLSWVDRKGAEAPLTAEPRGYVLARLSPDGSRVALDVRDEDSNIWVWHLQRSSLTRFTLGGEADSIYPVWSRDGRTIIFSADRDGQPNIYRQPADGTGSVERIGKNPDAQFPHGLTPDGKVLLFAQGGGAVRHLYTMQVDGDRTPTPLLKTNFDERNGEFSPDGKWVAYQSNQSGRDEIYVRPYPRVNDGLWQVSVGGGAAPAWRADARELYYVAPSGHIVAVSILTEPAFFAGTPEPLFKGPHLQTVGRSFDVTPDGKRFLMVKSSPQPPIHFIVVQNWFEELKQRVPTKSRAY